MTVKRVASLPVPAVVGMQITGSAPRFGLRRHLEVAHLRARPARRARIAMALAVSIGLPPPKPTRQSIVAGLQRGDAGLDHRVGRVGHGVAEDRRRDAGRAQRRQRLLDRAGGHHPGVGHHQRPRQAELGEHLGELGDRAAADHQQPRTTKEMITQPVLLG